MSCWLRIASQSSLRSITLLLLQLKLLLITWLRKIVSRTPWSCWDWLRKIRGRILKEPNNWQKLDYKLGEEIFSRVKKGTKWSKREGTYEIRLKRIWWAVSKKYSLPKIPKLRPSTTNFTTCQPRSVNLKLTSARSSWLMRKKVTISHRRQIRQKEW